MYKITVSNIKKHLVGDFSIVRDQVDFDQLYSALKEISELLERDDEKDFHIYVEPAIERTSR